MFAHFFIGYMQFIFNKRNKRHFCLEVFCIQSNQIVQFALWAEVEIVLTCKFIKIIDIKILRFGSTTQ